MRSHQRPEISSSSKSRRSGHSQSWFHQSLNEIQQRFDQGEHPSVEAYIADAPDAEAAVDLIYAHFVLETDTGNRSDPWEVIQRFPQYAELLERQFTFDRALQHVELSETETVPISSPHELTTNPLPRIGKYTVISKIAGGSQGEVFRAVHPDLANEVAIKISTTPVNASELDPSQILKEGQVLAQLEHPNLARVFDVGIHEGRPYLVSRYVRGRTLDSYLHQESPSQMEIAALIAKISRAVGTAHRMGITHLDIKPRNIVIDETDEPVLIDFGLAVSENAMQEAPEYESGSLRGTIAYMSPEHAHGKADLIGPQCDVFSLGAVLYYSVVGHPPYVEDGFLENLESAREGRWDRKALKQSTISKHIQTIIDTALQSEMESRYRNCTELADSLDAYAKRAERTKRRALFSLGALVPLLAILGVWMFFGRDVPKSGELSPVPYAQAAPLSVEVFHSGRFVNLLERTPLKNGDQLRVTAPIPPEQFGTLFALSSEGRLTELCHFDRQPKQFTLQFPTQSGKAVPIVGERGTELVFLCLSSDHPVSLKDLLQQDFFETTMPPLSPYAIARVDDKGVRLEGETRGFGAPVDLPSPDEQVLQRLEKMQEAISSNNGTFSAIAFFHAE
ncbi:serine/threonine protein kinase [Bremerella sp.]|uniref:serine/threonine protein kinase n=1 Tax=Bremerella sp. TaxID=2795602 RepID=UPI00391B49BA